MNKLSSILNDNYQLLYLDNPKYFLDTIINTNILYRDNLNLNNNITFGLEIEYQFFNRHLVDEYIKKHYVTWTSKKEDTIKMGGEISSPKLRDNFNTWQDLAAICKFLRLIHAKIAENTAGHVHVGASILELDVKKWRNFYKIYMLYEGILRRFFAGEYINLRKSSHEYAKPLAYELYKNLALINSDSLLDYCGFGNKQMALNCSYAKYRYSKELFHFRDTIEFRSPNGTLSEVIWQNNVNAIVKLIYRCTQELDEEYLDYLIEHWSYKDYQSDCVFIDDALQFVDLVFDNNLDKTYFLRQYFKNMESNLNYQALIKTKKFYR